MTTYAAGDDGPMTEENGIPNFCPTPEDARRRRMRARGTCGLCRSF